MTDSVFFGPMDSGKNGRHSHQSGRWHNIDGLLMDRYLARKAWRRSRRYLKDPAIRTQEDG